MMAKRIGWIGVVVLAALATASQAATHTWDGGAADDFWRSAANWVGDVAPTNGDSVALGATGDIRLDTAFTIENGQSLTDTGAGFNPELILEGSNAVLTLAAGGVMDIAFMRPRFVEGGQFIIEAGASLDTDHHGLGNLSATVAFIADAAGVTRWNNANNFSCGLDHLVVDLGGYDITNGTTLVLVDYAYDLGSGDLAIALTNMSQIAAVAWDGGAGDDNWSSDTNWVDDVVPVNGDAVVLTATAQSRLDSSWTIESGRSLTTTAPGFFDELVLQSDSILTLTVSTLYPQKWGWAGSLISLVYRSGKQANPQGPVKTS